MTTRRHCYPAAYYEWLCQALELVPGAEAEPAFYEPLFALNHAWVKGEALPDYAADAAVMRAYACYYMTINMPKLWAVLDRSQPALDAWLAQESLAVTEFGCGPGTFLWAFLFYLRARRPQAFKRSLQLVGIDRSATALDQARRFHEVLQTQPAFARHRIEFRQGGAEQLPSDTAQLLILGNVLTENAAVTPGAVSGSDLIMIEPGTREVFHQYILPWRQELLQAGWSIAFPCPGAHACPMAADNWCHFDVNRFVLPFIQRLSNRAKRLNPRHHFCGFYFSRSQTPVNGWRALSRLRRAHRSGIRWLCDGEHLAEAVLNRRARSDANRDFLTAEPGDLLTIAFARQGPERFLTQSRLEADDQVSSQNTTDQDRG